MIVSFLDKIYRYVEQVIVLLSLDQEEIGIHLSQHP